MKNNKLNKKWMIYNQIKSFHLALIVSKSAPMNATVSAANDGKNWPQTDREIIWCASNYGPIFGSGYLWALSLLAISATAKAFDYRCHRREYNTEGTDKSTFEESTNMDFHQWNNGGKMVQSDRIRRVFSALTTGSSNLPFMAKLQTNTAERSAVIVCELWSLIYCWCWGMRTIEYEIGGSEEVQKGRKVKTGVWGCAESSKERSDIYFGEGRRQTD